MRRRPFSRAQRAALRCQDVDFRFWLWESGRIGVIPGDADDAAAVVRVLCRVKSRREFDTDPAAGRRWDGLSLAFEQDRGLAARDRAA